MSKPKAYSYIRFSTPEQSRGDSYRRQTELSRRYALEHGLDLDETLTFQDLGVSAFTGQNLADGALGTFIRAVDEGRIRQGSYLLVESLDRLSRDTVTRAFSQFSSLLERGVNVVTLQDMKVYRADSLSSNFADLLVSLATMFRAHEESLTKSRRLREAWTGKRRAAVKGERKLTGKCPAWLSLSEDRRSFVVIEERAEIVRRVFRLTLEGVGAGRIATMFNTEGVPTFGRSEGWHPSYIKKILENEAVVGLYQPMKTERRQGKRTRVPEGEPLVDYFPAVVDMETFAKARNIRSSRRISGGKKGVRFSNLFTGLAFCGVCGGPLHFINKGEGEHYLACSNARRNVGECRAPSWQYTPAERFILIALDEVDYRDLFPSVYETTKENLKKLDAALLVKEGELEKTTEQVDRVVSLLIDRPESAALQQRLDTLEGTKEDLQRAVDALRNQIADERDKLDNLQHDHDATRDALRRLASAHATASDDEVYQLRSSLHQLLKRTVERITLAPVVDDPEWHGVITLRFQGAAEYERRVNVARGQREARSCKVTAGVETGGRYIRL